MKELVDRIQKDGRILGEGVLKVDSFVTHQVNPVLMEQMGKRFAEVFKEQGSFCLFFYETSDKYDFYFS